MNPFSAHTAEIRRLVSEWEPKLLVLPDDLLSTHFNSQHRTIKMILGHLCDSATDLVTKLNISPLHTWIKVD